MFKFRKPDIPENQVAKFSPDPVAIPAPAQVSRPLAQSAPQPAPDPAAPPAAEAPAPPEPASAAALPAATLPARPQARIPTPTKEVSPMSSSSTRFPTPPSTISGTANPPPQSVRTSLRPDTTERRLLVISKGISITGTISDAERLVVEGTLDSKLVRAGEFSVAPGGIFKGEAEVDEAEIAGIVEGTVTARTSLQVRSQGKLIGTARCKRLQVEDGGQISGKVEMLTEGGTPETTHAAPAASHNESWPSAMPVKPDLAS